MHDNKPEHELEVAFQQWNEDGGMENGHKVEVPIYVLEDAVQRLKRYEAIVHNLTAVGNYLWKENLRKYGERQIHDKETPSGVHMQDTYKQMCSFVNRLNPKEITMEDSFVELALQMSRFKTGDPTGLSQYLDKEEAVFGKLEFDDNG